MVKAKKECFKKWWQQDRNEKNFRSYKQTSKEAERNIRNVKLRAYEDFYARLYSKDGEKNTPSVPFSFKSLRTGTIIRIDCSSQ